MKGGYPLRKLALFRLEREYERIEETIGVLLDMEIHEHPNLREIFALLKEIGSS
jgi:hypothetical protein